MRSRLSNPKTACIIDENPEMREFLQLLLESHQFKVETFSSVDAALNHLCSQDFRPHAIITGGNMHSKTNGYDLLKQMAEDPICQKKGTALVLYCTHPNTQKALQLGANLVVAHPSSNIFTDLVDPLLAWVKQASFKSINTRSKAAGRV